MKPILWTGTVLSALLVVVGPLGAQVDSRPSSAATASSRSSVTDAVLVLPAILPPGAERYEAIVDAETHAFMSKLPQLRVETSARARDLHFEGHSETVRKVYGVAAVVQWEVLSVTVRSVDATLQGIPLVRQATTVKLQVRLSSLGPGGAVASGIIQGKACEDAEAAISSAIGVTPADWLIQSAHDFCGRRTAREGETAFRLASDPPKATVTIDGVLIGTTPLTVTRPNGTFLTIVIQHGDRESVTQHVLVGPELGQLYGGLLIHLGHTARRNW